MNPSDLFSGATVSETDESRTARENEIKDDMARDDASGRSASEGFVENDESSNAMADNVESLVDDTSNSQTAQNNDEAKGKAAAEEEAQRIKQQKAETKAKQRIAEEEAKQKRIDALTEAEKSMQTDINNLDLRNLVKNDIISEELYKGIVALSALSNDMIVRNNPKISLDPRNYMSQQTMSTIAGMRMSKQLYKVQQDRTRIIVKIGKQTNSLYEKVYDEVKDQVKQIKTNDSEETKKKKILPLVGSFVLGAVGAGRSKIADKLSVAIDKFKKDKEVGKRPDKDEVVDKAAEMNKPNSEITAVNNEFLALSETVANKVKMVNAEIGKDIKDIDVTVFGFKTDDKPIEQNVSPFEDYDAKGLNCYGLTKEQTDELSKISADDFYTTVLKYAKENIPNDDERCEYLDNRARHNAEIIVATAMSYYHDFEELSLDVDHDLSGLTFDQHMSHMVRVNVYGANSEKTKEFVEKCQIENYGSVEKFEETKRKVIDVRFSTDDKSVDDKSADVKPVDKDVKNDKSADVKPVKTETESEISSDYGDDPNDDYEEIDDDVSTSSTVVSEETSTTGENIAKATTKVVTEMATTEAIVDALNTEPTEEEIEEAKAKLLAEKQANENVKTAEEIEQERIAKEKQERNARIDGLTEWTSEDQTKYPDSAESQAPMVPPANIGLTAEEKKRAQAEEAVAPMVAEVERQVEAKTAPMGQKIEMTQKSIDTQVAANNMMITEQLLEETNAAKARMDMMIQKSDMHDEIGLDELASQMGY